MMMRTTYGYSIDTENGELPPIITGEQFAAATRGRYSPSDMTVLQALNAVSDAVRRHCQWHVAPVLSCRWQGAGDGGKLLRLPALEVTGVTSVTDGAEHLRAGDYEWREDGMLRRNNFTVWSRKWRAITVDYTAGFNPSQILDLVKIIAQITASDLAAAPGVNREQAGQVAITYNQTAPGVSGGITLLDRDKELLEPFVLTRAF